MSSAEFAAVDFAPPHVALEGSPETGFIFSSALPLQPYRENLGQMLRHWAEQTPDRLFLAERAADGGWRRLTYAEVNQQADAIAQALLDRKLGPYRPVMILSGNAVDHALLMLGCFIAGVPVVPVSVPYSLLSRDHLKLRFICEEICPGMIYVADAEQFAAPLAALNLDGIEIVASRGSLPEQATTPFADLLATPVSAEVDKALAQVGGKTVAKILYTSGSTGQPKGVINTHGMLCANQQMLAQIWPFTDRTPPVLVDWLPWNHTFGGNHNFNLVLNQGGSLYIDDGKPAPGLVEKTVRNLAAISPTIYFNVPVGYAMLLPFLEQDEKLRNCFFKDLQLIFYAGAALPQDLWERLEKVAVQATGRKVMMTSSWGSTETSPLATAAHFPLEKAGVIGIPCPGVALKMVPNGDSFELRVKGPNVTPGYFRRPDLTAAAFDEEGYYLIGDAGRFVDPDEPARGISFAGRVAEDFKLMSGTWVRAGLLRVAVLEAAAPVLQFALVTGHDREEVGILGWPNLAACKKLCDGIAEEIPAAELIRRPEITGHLRRALTRFNAAQQGSATRIGRVMLMSEPPDSDAGEITDKGYINQRAALQRRQALVEQLYADPPGAAVIILS
ncbi:feruloyl-CoA synthase [Geothermobacter hydrogeniphilus]|uniref:Feruloyl-CoA synthase n=1 Tax=Geothermobacter hydrogeniphilus TaxID=1969733 RepID=A0A1X0Y2G1_9BACT|nr:feruloyl-CoA synthase [Geothermobacter hydrogeniphilus]ORJ59287.1 feruloyl-CoA synthase [Geothermobacter hydrogeniphilus]